jgi:hypothetical protein
MFTHPGVPLGDGDGLVLACGVAVGLAVRPGTLGLGLGRVLLADGEADLVEVVTGLPLPSGLLLALGR